MRYIAKCAHGEDLQAGDLAGCNDVGELVHVHKMCTDPLGDTHGNLSIARVVGRTFNNDLIVELSEYSNMIYTIQIATDSEWKRGMMMR